MEKLNCWEYKKCQKYKDCSAYNETRLDGSNYGRNGGRACWLVVGTLCDGDTQGYYAAKIHNCKECEFYKYVMENEENRESDKILLKKMR